MKIKQLFVSPKTVSSLFFEKIFHAYTVFDGKSMGFNKIL